MMDEGLRWPKNKVTSHLKSVTIVIINETLLFHPYPGNHDLIKHKFTVLVIENLALHILFFRIEVLFTSNCAECYVIFLCLYERKLSRQFKHEIHLCSFFSEIKCIKNVFSWVFLYFKIDNSLHTFKCRFHISFKLSGEWFLRRSF